MIALPGLSQQKPLQAVTTGLGAGDRGVCHRALPLHSLRVLGHPHDSPWCDKNVLSIQVPFGTCVPGV